jgi:hypothetical protein
MAWTTIFTKGVDDMLKINKLDPPINKEMPNLQAFVQAVDSAEKIEGELDKTFKAYLKAKKDYQDAYDDWKKLETAVDKNLKVFDKAIKAYIKDGRNHAEKLYETGCTNMEKGLDLIESKIKAMGKEWGPPGA